MSVNFRQRDGSATPCIPHDFAVVISDSIEAPAIFLIVQYISLAIKAKRPCTLIGISHSYAYYVAILKKHGIQLPNETEKGNFAFIDGTTIVTEEDPLSVLHGALARSMIPGSLVVVDDTTALLYAGSKEVELLRFLRTLRATARLTDASVLLVYHDDAFSSVKNTITRSQGDAFLLRQLIQLCDVWVQTRSLRAQMTGELVYHRAPALVGGGPLTEHTLNRPLQYKLSETGPIYFAKGTAQGFL